MKRILVFVLRWCAPSVILFVFMILPSLLHSVYTDTTASNWIVNIFYTVVLSNTFLGAARVFNNPKLVKKNLDQYKKTDKDSLNVSIIFGHLTTTIGTTLLCFYGLFRLYPFIGWPKYLFATLFGISTLIINYAVYKIQLRYIRCNEEN